MTGIEETQREYISLDFLLLNFLKCNYDYSYKKLSVQEHFRTKLPLINHREGMASTPSAWVMHSATQRTPLIWVCDSTNTADIIIIDSLVQLADSTVKGTSYIWAIRGERLWNVEEIQEKKYVF